LARRPRIIPGALAVGTANYYHALPNEESKATEREQIAHVSVPPTAPELHDVRRHFIPLARWEGAVVERFDSYFIAEVIDMDSDERAIVEFEVSELAIDDVPLCEPGALFYWSIGYEVKEGGQRSRSSVIRFRRLGSAVRKRA
jgi:hypothetical protein